MPYNHYDLPKYPLEYDMWDKIAADPRPKMVYGMGNGADKLFERLSLYGVQVSEVFASDGFVRGHSYKGYLVKTLSEIAEQYDDFIILLSFASNRREVIDMIKSIDARYDLYIPDMPVAGDAYFDKHFYNENYEKILLAYNTLTDEDSKNAFAALINYKLFARAEYLFGAFGNVSDIYALLPRKIESSVDAGAYNGDTVREIMEFRPEIEKIYAFEPDRRNYKKLSKFIAENNLESKVEAINAAVYSEDKECEFSGSGNRNSSVGSTVSYEHKTETVKLLKIDSVVKDKVDYIKYDVEGAEMQALIGSYETIEKFHPSLLISLYHRSEDIFSLVLYMAQTHKDYKYYLRRTECFPAWEIALIAI